MVSTHIIEGLLQENVKKTGCYVISFDENLNDIAQTCKMDTLIRYFDNGKGQGKVRCWNLSFMRHTTHV